MKNMKIRKPVVAGLFYNNNKDNLNNQLTTFYEKTNITSFKNKKIKALIVPHAGYVYSGQTAMFAYKELFLNLLLNTSNYYKVIILAPVHTQYFEGISITKNDYYETTFGKIKICDSVLRKNNFEIAHENEHSIEVQLPFLQYVFDKAKINFEILPILVGNIKEKNISFYAKQIEKEVQKNTIIIVSTDLSHYLSKEEAKKVDKETINNILNNKKNIEACGKNPILILNEISKERKWKKELLKYSTSFDINKDKNNVVGYASLNYYENDKNILLKIAKKAIYNKLNNKKNNFDEIYNHISKEYKEKNGVFVTLYKHGELRGCIGNIFSKEEIFFSVINNAIYSAFEDYRFTPLTKEELKDIEIEISILSTPKPCLLKDIKKGDGVILEKDNYFAVYLPQVWEQLSNKNLFLGSLCEKAGLSNDCYKNEKTKFKKFSVKIIKSKE